MTGGGSPGAAPLLTDPELLRRLRMDDDVFFRWMLEEVAPSVPPRRCDAAAVELALGYPWVRPAGSYALVGGEVVDPDPSLARGRHPVLAIGSNGAPDRLRVKFGHLDDRDVLVVAGELEDLDVGVVPTVTPYGSVPATLFASPGTRVRAAVLWLTRDQLTSLTFSELTYRLLRLDATFAPDDPALPADDPLAYVARLGALHLDGAPVALAAVPARHRTARALHQRELLEALGELALGRPVRAEEVVRVVHEDLTGAMERFAATIWRLGRPLPGSMVRGSAA